MDITLAPVSPRSAIILVTSMGNSLNVAAEVDTKRFAMTLFPILELQNARPRRRVALAIKRVATNAMQKPLRRSIACDKRVRNSLIQGWEGSRGFLLQYFV